MKEGGVNQGEDSTGSSGNVSGRGGGGMTEAEEDDGGWRRVTRRRGKKGLLKVRERRKGGQ